MRCEKISWQLVGWRHELRSNRGNRRGAGAFFGLPLRRYELEEIAERAVKTRKSDLGTIFNKLFLSDPEFQRLVREVVIEGRPDIGAMEPEAAKSVERAAHRARR